MEKSISTIGEYHHDIHPEHSLENNRANCGLLHRGLASANDVVTSLDGGVISSLSGSVISSLSGGIISSLNGGTKSLGGS